MANTNKINLADLEKIAREQGLPALDNQISKEPSPLFEKIGKPDERIHIRLRFSGFVIGQRFLVYAGGMGYIDLP